MLAAMHVPMSAVAALQTITASNPMVQAMGHTFAAGNGSLGFEWLARRWLSCSAHRLNALGYHGPDQGYVQDLVFSNQRGLLSTGRGLGHPRIHPASAGSPVCVVLTPD